VIGAVISQYVRFSSRFRSEPDRLLPASSCATVPSVSHLLLGVRSVAAVFDNGLDPLRVLEQSLVFHELRFAESSCT